MFSRSLRLAGCLAVAAFSFIHSPAPLQAATYENIAFGGTNSVGALPAGGLTKGPDGNYYGTTQSGGAFGGGTVFRMTPDGTVSTVVSFDFDGGWPTNGVTVAKDGSLYGTTTGPWLGQPNAHGTIFRVTPDGKLKTLLTIPYSPPLPEMVTAGDDGNVYGIFPTGGAQNQGRVFRMTPDGTITTLVSFTGANGSHPAGPLAKAADGSFYGSTYSGGAHNAGTIFRVTTTGGSTRW